MVSQIKQTIKETLDNATSYDQGHEIVLSYSDGTTTAFYVSKDLGELACLYSELMGYV